MENELADIIPFLPEDWRDKAKEYKALQRPRNVRTADELLFVNLLYTSIAGSFQATAEMMQLGAGIHLDKNAVYKRVLASGDWLRYLARGVCEKSETLLPKPAFLEGYNVVLVDASELSAAGSKGGDYFLHYAFDLFDFACRDVQITPISQGEKLSLHDLRKGDIVEGDRVYGTISGMEYARSQGADFILRLRRNAFKLYDESGAEVDILSHAKGMKAQETRELSCYYRVGQESKPVRIIVMRNDEAAISRARNRQHRMESKKQLKSTPPQTALMHEYIVLATSLDFTGEQILELYRARWQIEMVFLRLKELFGIGEIPCKKPDSVKAWFYGKLLLASVCAAQVRRYSFSPTAAFLAFS